MAAPGVSKIPDPGQPAAVIVACDAAYLRYASVLARQLAAVPGRRYDVLIGSPEPLDLPAPLVQAGVGAVHATDAVIAARLPLDARRSLATYMEVFLAERLRGVYDRILVLDADILLERGDPSAILTADLHGHAVAAVRDNMQWRSPDRRVEEFRALGWPAAPYLNGGAVIIDTAGWARDDLTARCRAFAGGRLAGLRRHDQSLLNGVLHGDWAELSPLWNWQFTWASAHLTAMADPCLVHFIGPAKPWKAEAASVVPLRYRAAYAAGDTPPERSWPAARDLRRALFRQWRAAGPMLAYLRRFSTADSVLPGARAPGTLPPG